MQPPRIDAATLQLLTTPTPGPPGPGFVAGQRVAAQVLGRLAGGEVLIDVGGRHVVARPAVQLIAGQTLELEVVRTTPTVEMRLLQGSARFSERAFAEAVLAHARREAPVADATSFWRALSQLPPDRLIALATQIARQAAALATPPPAVPGPPTAQGQGGPPVSPGAAAPSLPVTGSPAPAPPAGAVPTAQGSPPTGAANPTPPAVQVPSGTPAAVVGPAPAMASVPGPTPPSVTVTILPPVPGAVAQAPAEGTPSVPPGGPAPASAPSVSTSAPTAGTPPAMAAPAPPGPGAGMIPGGATASSAPALDTLLESARGGMGAPTNTPSPSAFASAAQRALTEVLGPIDGRLDGGTLAVAIKQVAEQGGLFFETRMRAALAAATSTPGSAVVPAPSLGDVRVLLGLFGRSLASTAAPVPGGTSTPAGAVIGDDGPLAESVLREQARLAEQVLARQVEFAHRFVKDGVARFDLPLDLPHGPSVLRMRVRREAPTRTGDEPHGFSFDVALSLGALGQIGASAHWFRNEVGVALYVEHESARAVVDRQMPGLVAGLRSAGFSAVQASLEVAPERFRVFDDLPELPELPTPPAGVFSARV